MVKKETGLSLSRDTIRIYCTAVVQISVRRAAPLGAGGAAGLNVGEIDGNYWKLVEIDWGFGCSFAFAFVFSSVVLCTFSVELCG
jgi:hypothetical protein